MGVGGAVESVTIDGREFSVAADADVQMQLGGKTKATEANGNGTARTLLTPVPWMLEDVQLSIDDQNGDLEFLQALSDAPGEQPITITLASGQAYAGTGSVNGDVKQGTANTTAPITLSGTGKLVRI